MSVEPVPSDSPRIMPILRYDVDDDEIEAVS
jgi:hypothetical protein